MTEDHENFDAMKEYKFVKSQVPRFEYNDPAAINLIKQQVMPKYNENVFKGQDLRFNSSK